MTSRQAVVPPGTSTLDTRSSPDWLANLILTSKTITAAAELLPFPYIHGAFSPVVPILEAIQKMAKNREDFRELCGSIVEIQTMLQGQITRHGSVGTESGFEELCHKLQSLLCDVQEGLGNIQKNQRKSFGRRLREFASSSSIENEISAYRTRLNELRSNFMLIATMNADLNVTKLSSLVQLNLSVVSTETLVSLPPITTYCPPPSRIFKGRRDILDEMHQYFSQDFGQRHVFLLHGLGGSGKTQIALKFLEETDISRFTHNFFLDASSMETLKTGLANIAVTQSIGQDHQDALLWLAHQAEWLLIFDNADDPNINLYHFFPQSNCGNILITSRNPQLSIHAPDAHQHVSNMDVEDAVQLLLTSSVQPARPANQSLATEIVKTLHCFPLAVVQAGAFISKTGDMGRYLSLYRQNQARLLSTMPTQSHDKYAWSVYTTWDISFQQLSNLAAKFLQLCSFLYRDGITESIFSNAATYVPCPLGPTEEEIKEAQAFLANFLSDSGKWDALAFIDMAAEVQGYSLISKDPNTGQFSIHPLVHDWSRNTVTEIDTTQECTAAILAMSVVENQVFAHRLQPHLDTLSVGAPLLANKFPLPFGHVYYASGNFHRAKELQIVVLEKSQKILGPHHPDTLTAMANLAITYHHLGNFRDAELLQATVVDTCKHNLGTDHPRTLHAMSTLALTYGDLGKFLDAEQLLVVVLKKSREILGINHPDILHAMTNLAVTFKGLGKFPDAEELEVEVLSKRKEILGADDRETLFTMGNLAITYRALEKYKDAEELELVVLEKRKQILGEDHPHTLSAMLSLAATYRKLRKFEDAEKLEAVVLEKRTQILGRDHPRTFDAMASVASTYRSLGKFDLAKDLEILVLENRKQNLGEEHPRTLNAMANLGTTYRSLGKLREAEHLQKIVLEKRRQLLGPSHPGTLRAMENLEITSQGLREISSVTEKADTHLITTPS